MKLKHVSPFAACIADTALCTRRGRSEVIFFLFFLIMKISLFVATLSQLSSSFLFFFLKLFFLTIVVQFEAR